MHLIKNHSKRKWIYEVNNMRKIVDVCIKPTTWQTLDTKIVLPFSVDSAIYHGTNGDAKINALLSAVKAYAKQDILILLCEGAHLNALSLTHGAIDEALKMSRALASQLMKRFSDVFSDYEVILWEDFVWKYPLYNQFKDIVMNLYNTIIPFKDLMHLDTLKLRIPTENIDRELFYSKSILDFVEMLAGIKVMEAENYKILIYPGSLPSSFQYLIKNMYIDMKFINAAIKCKEMKFNKFV